MARRWTERDISILQDLYEVREMTKHQVISKYFVGRERYGVKRLWTMKREWLISSKVYGLWIEGKKTLAAHYRLTEKGLRVLVKSGRISDGQVRARDLELSAKQRQYVMDANELHVRIPEVNYLDSRAIKRKHALNRGDLVMGTFETGHGDYGVYILQPNGREQTTVKIIKEISGKWKFAGRLVFYKSEAAKQLFERVSEQLAMTTGGMPVHLLPYNERGIAITRDLILKDDLNALAQLLKDHGTLELITSKHGFRHRIRDFRECYAIELLTGDMLILKRSLKNYNVNQYRNEGRKVRVFCWSDELETVRQAVGGLVGESDYVEIVPVEWCLKER